MSVRPREALEASQAFSLRDVVPAAGGHQASHVGAQGGLKFSLDGLAMKPPPAHAPPRPTTPAPPFQAAHVPSKGQAGLSLRFGAPAQQAPQTPAAAPPLTTLNPMTFAAKPAPAPAAPPPAAQAPAALPQRRGWSLRSGPAPVADTPTKQQDVMRLTAYVDDLTQRLQRTQSKLESTELQLARTSQALCSERQTVQAKLAGFKKDLTASHEIEAKLRSELAQRPAKPAVNRTDFMASVENALQADFQVQTKNRQVSELETRISALAEMKAALEQEVSALSAARATAMAESSNLHECNVDGSQRLAAVELELEAHEARVADAQRRSEEAEAAAVRAEAGARRVEDEAKTREQLARTAITSADAAEADARRREAAAQPAKLIDVAAPSPPASAASSSS